MSDTAGWTAEEWAALKRVADAAQEVCDKLQPQEATLDVDPADFDVWRHMVERPDCSEVRLRLSRSLGAILTVRPR